jgi:hypothetical protein
MALSDRKRPLWPLLTAALIGLPLLYVASFGPVCWWLPQGEIPVVRRGIAAAYWPLGRTAVLTKFSPLTWYLFLRVKPAVKCLDVPVDPSGKWDLLVRDAGP